MPSPWNSEKVLIAAFGNTVAGVNLGISALVDAPLRSQLAGDFVMINDTRVQTVDTRLEVPVVSAPVVEDPSGVSTPLPQNNSPMPSRPGWLLPVLVLAIALIVVVIVIVILTNFRSTRKNS